MVVHPIVIDHGTSATKSGLATYAIPQEITPSTVGIPRHRGVMVGAYGNVTYIGKDIYQKRGIFSLKPIFNRGRVADWDLFEGLWEHLFDDVLQLPPEESPILITERSKVLKDREQMVQLLFEKFESPSVNISLPAVLSLYSSGYVTGMVLDSGEGLTQAVPVYEGYALSHAIQAVPIGGQDVNKLLQQKLSDRGYSIAHNSTQLEYFKQQHCYIPDEFKRSNSKSASFLLPDGQEIIMNEERSSCAQLFFEPEELGLEIPTFHELIYKNIRKCDIDLRAKFWQNIILSGGNSMLTGLPERLKTQIREAMPNTSKLQIHAPKNRALSSWIGGSILANTSEFSRLCLTKDDYFDYGPAMVHRVCF